MKTAAFLLAAALAGGAGAHAEDPLKSQACASALSALQHARSAGAPPAGVESARAAAAGACLGSEVRPQRPSRTVQAPVRVPPPQVEVPPPAASLAVPPPRLPPPAVDIGRAPLPAQCDPAGCWSSGGTHLRHVPPHLAGPAGGCLQQGGTAYCP